MKKILFLFLPFSTLAQDGNFAENDLVATGDRNHSFLFHDLKITELDEIRFDIFHQDITGQTFRGFSNGGTQHSWFMRVMDGVDRATFQLICDTEHFDSQIELAGTGNTPIHLDSDAYVRLGNQSANKPGELRFYNTGNSNYIGFKAPSIFYSDFMYTLPLGTSTGFLFHDGAGNLSWEVPGDTVYVASDLPVISHLNIFCGARSSVDSGGTQYFGNLCTPLSGVAGNSRVYIREDCVISAAEVSCMAQIAGTSEPWEVYISVEGVDYLIAVASQATQFRTWTNTALDIPVIAGQYFEMKIVNPAWQTKPINCTFGGYITITQ